MAMGIPPQPDEVAAPAAADQTPDADRLAQWEQRTRPLIVAAAVLPLFGAFTAGPDDAVVWIVAFGTWLVFLVDLIVHMRLVPGYLRTRVGMFDLFLVVTTFPWYLVLGNETSGLTQLLRLARLERVFKVAASAPAVQRFMKRLGRPVLYAAVMLVTCSIIVTRAEGPGNGFTSFGVGLWWGIVTLATVGYGDLVPVTPVGRVTASVLMISGIGLLGTVAASLSSLFRMQDSSGEAPASEPAGPDGALDSGGSAPTGPAGPPRPRTDSGDVTIRDLQQQIASLHTELGAMRALLEGRASGGSGGSGGSADPPGASSR